jgi:hypothetical protein
MGGPVVPLFEAPAWLLAALFLLVVMVLIGPERTYQRALELLRAVRSDQPAAPGTQPGPAPTGNSVRTPDNQPSGSS